ncbi:MAG: DUF2878 domain-containing protein, partial [Gammaproteobacteria bacterium]|nr:DUF2878 domain-containing protein [Gammaproteobacteria bacterium]NIR83231.1 DUF2878 domain-containing protein [Gammaproteobacteria bacterium]NIR91039.1 DUF2878 domain-containing protein [Gammaproteobacteria bacterium]NIU04396.1 DUF2878 domain-containing protein [Gammaproteobacteria bacterium]NIV52619.1 DUF2878 family protein [Gammaproteobacteria bacterium]
TGWFASVLGAAHGVAWLGPAYYALWLPAHTLAAQPQGKVELKVLLAAAPLGYVVDSLLVLSGFI